MSSIEDLENLQLDLFNILGVNVNSSTEEIKTKYSELSKIYHPDKTSDPKKKKIYDKIFQNITVAYKTLSNPKKRQEYTNLLQNTFSDLKSDYQVPKEVENENQNNFDLDNFNQQFSSQDQSNQLHENFSDLLNQRAASVDELLKTRENCQVPDLTQAIDLELTQTTLNDLYKQIEILIQEEKRKEKKEDKKEEDDKDRLGEINRSKITKVQTTTFQKSLLSQIGHIKDNFNKDISLLIDFISLVTGLNEDLSQTLKIDKEFVQYLKTNLQYEEPNWKQQTTNELTPYNFYQNEGMNIEDSYTLLK